MKKILLYLLAATLCSVSCNPDLLDTNPTDRVSGEFILADTDGGYQVLNGTIRAYWQWGWSTASNTHQSTPQGYVLMADVMGEDLVQASSGNGWYWYDYTYTVKSNYTSSGWRSYDLWNFYYTIISNVNYILDAQDTMEGSQSDINYIMGNAYALRAHCYAQLGMIFARSYIGHEDRLCVPIYTEPTVAGTSGKARSTNREVFAQAMSDINTAIDLLNGLSRLDISHIDYYVANGFKARIALYMGNYLDALEAATAALSGGASYAFDEEFFYNDANHESVLWGVALLSTEATTNPAFLSHMDWHFGGYGYASRKCCSSWLYEKIGTNDARRNWWNYEDLDGEGTMGYQQYKFQYGSKTENANASSGTGYDVDPQTNADYIFMRAPEMQLIIAEAQCWAGQDGEAQAALNALMATRDDTYNCTKTGTELSTSTTPDTETGSLLEEIILQRRIELWCEVGRIYDIKRLRQGFTRSTDWGHSTAGVSALNNLATTDPESFDWVLTIPQTELDANSLMVQNPLGSYAEDPYGDDPALNPSSDE